MLVLSLAEHGSLQDYLRSNSTPFNIYCRMAISIARGLSHLHTKIQKADQKKLCICHRDLNSRNILVKADLSCCLCDFGFAMKVNSSRYDYQGEMILAETKSIYEVGTLRYMAPEILEGAVNLRDCETSLKQIDVYSLGLVLWELCMRCQEFYPPDMQTPPYKAPYEAEIGVHPSFDQMRSLVLQHKARPMFPPFWGGGLAAHASKEICEDLWVRSADVPVAVNSINFQPFSGSRPRRSADIFVRRGASDRDCDDEASLTLRLDLKLVEHKQRDHIGSRLL